MDDLLADFLTETNENLAELDVALLALERTPDDAATLGLIFRMVHTIKGTCGFLGLPRLERVAHAAENILGQLRDGTLSASPDMVSQILAALDRIKAILSGLSRSGAEPAGDDVALIEALNATASGKAPPHVEHPAAPAAVVTAPVAVAAAAADVTPPAAAAASQPTAAAVHLQSPLPAAATPPAAPAPVVAVAPEKPVAPEPPATPPAPATPPRRPDTIRGGSSGERCRRTPQGQPVAGPAVAQTIRVTVDVLEDLMTLVSRAGADPQSASADLPGCRKTAASRHRCSGCPTSPRNCRKGS